MAPHSDWTGSRRLLRLLRDIMKGGGGVQDRLDRVTELIAQDIVAEVCSIYVKRAGDVLELFASKGLKPEAVHRTRLRVGEGLVGQIASQARGLALSEARSHPNFAHRPETGEEIYHSLLGVPILRDGHVLGVLVVQNVTPRSYGEEEVEALETVAMVLAELVAGGELIGAEEARHAESETLLPTRLTGIVLNEGPAMGLAVPLRREIVITRIVAEDREAERGRLDAALRDMGGALDELLGQSEVAKHGESREVLEAYRMFAEDRGWRGRMMEAVRGGLTAEAAVQKVQNDTRRRLTQVKDAYLRERLVDLEDLANRLLQHLVGRDTPQVEQEVPENAVLIARALGPAELLDFDRERLRGVVLEEGSPMAHAAILARAFDIPMIGRCAGLLKQVRAGDFIIVDGDHGQVLVRPGEGIKQTFQQSVTARNLRQAASAESRDLAPVTKDGQRISININAGLLLDMAQLQESGADGIGLYRTEVPFMVRDAFPGVRAQTEIYTRALDLAEGKPVVFRTLDVGGDKVLPYWSGGSDENPAMGWRAIRIGLDQPAMLRQQLRALIRAAAGRSLHVMFPMIAEIAEFEAAKALLDQELKREDALGRPLPQEIQVGVMFEVPALAWQLPLLFARCDFVSVGSNDLFQFLFASDRGNPRLSRRYDVLSPPVLRFLSTLVEHAEGAGMPLSICGEMAGHPLEALALLGCGFRRLSMSPPSVGPIRNMVRSVETQGLRRYIAQLVEQPDHSVRERLRAYALDHEISI